MSCSAALVGRQAAQVFFDAIERLDLCQTFLRYWSRARLGKIMQLAAGMRPAISQCHILSGPFQQAVVTSIAIDLQSAAEAFQNIVCILTGSPRCICEGDTGGIQSARI